MFIDDLQKVLTLGYETMRPLLIMSAPGVGKSDSVRDFAKTLGKTYDEPVGIIEVRGASLNPGELADISYVSDNAVKSAPQDWVPTTAKVEAGLCPPRGLIFLDELGDSLMSVQSSLQRLLLDRKLGSQKLADGWYCVAATNEAKHKAAAGRLSTALINRCILVFLIAEADRFYAWGINNGIDHRILAFVRFRPDSLSSFDPTKRTENPAFCSPRSLEIASDVLKQGGVISEPLMAELLTGTLGDGVGSELNSFIRIMDSLPDLDGILAKPETYPVPEKIDVAYATIGALINRATKENVSDVMKFFVRFGTELSVVATKDLARKEPSVFKTKEFCAWSSDNIRFAV